jgi:hypothetical protein
MPSRLCLQSDLKLDCNLTYQGTDCRLPIGG